MVLMQWQKLHKDYPIAYEHMVNTFRCLYTDVVKHPDKRDLYEFFDGEGLFIEMGHGWYSVDSGRNGEYREGSGFNSRIEAETEAFTKAFEILNDRLG